jgi:hypothetical protein
VLSQSRADAVKTFLEQDVDAWLAFYDEQGATKWGSREDRLRIRSLPDFGTRLTEGAEGKAADVNGETEAGHGATIGANSSSGTRSTNGAVASSTPYAANGEQSKPKKPESVVEWFLRTCGLEVDDIAEPKTQRALIDEYMGVGTVTLRETPGHPLSIATLGEGEDYPLAETGLPLDVAASNNAGGASGHRETQNTTLNP